MSVEITVKGFPQAITGITILSQKALPLVVETLQEAGEEMADKARTNAPVKTGALKASIGSDTTPTGAIVRATAPYAGFVEFGTSKMRGRAYMSQAASEIVDELQDKVGRELAKA